MNNDRRKTIFITGASRGFGFALTKQFISNQWKVAPLVRKDKDATILKRIDEYSCFPIISDITDNSLQSSIQKSIKHHDGIDVLINNAGAGGSGVLLNETKSDEVLSLIDVHCLGVLRVTQAVMPFMKNDGIIINVSSRFGSISKVSTGELDNVPCSYCYRIAKAAQNMLTQCMCREFKNSGLKICSIHPGRLKTDSASVDADKTPEEAAAILFEMLNSIEHGKFYSLFEGSIEW
ncbi:MAG: SDR family NAD(P)-dependent oxidoreductase [Desulfobacterales bacterium]|nr:SDR family NAD(P)-dependent oxidoreductase [Desulfobacterales bacterium]